jgi:segregation and condensation protein A
LSYLVHLRQFEGPLGLLLYLIRKEEMDIMDINVNDITRQYLDYIRQMKELDLEVAGEFVAMAATLIHIKSRMLLPQYNDEGESVEVDDPRKELVQKLLEYQKFQDAAKNLYERPLVNRDVYLRGVRENFAMDELGEIITEDDGLFSLIGAYRKAVRKAERFVHKVRPKVQSIAMRVLEIKDRLIVGSRVLLRDLLKIGSAPQRAQLLVTFLSMLELGRMGYVSLFQNDIYGDIYIETKKVIERNVLERVQEFESIGAEVVAKSIINEAIEDQIDMQEAMTSDDETQMSFAPTEAQQIPLEQINAQEILADANDIAADEELLQAEAEFASDEGIAIDAPLVAAALAPDEAMTESAGGDAGGYADEMFIENEIATIDESFIEEDIRVESQEAEPHFADHVVNNDANVGDDPMNEPEV